MESRQLTVDVLLTPDERRAALLADARAGLTSEQKTLSPIWFYDEAGSELFDAITRLPEYYLTRAERGLLAAHAADIAARSGATTLVELGSGSSEKTRLLLDAFLAGGGLRRFVPLDVSEEFLRSAAADLAAAYPALEVHAVVGDFHRHLAQLPAGGRRLVAFLGSTIGNLTPDERDTFLADLAAACSDGDGLLLGVDLVKDRAKLLAAYNDADGLTAEFNRNALRMVNASLSADFDPGLFEHVARWNEHDAWIEMHLRATSAHEVRIGELDLDLKFVEGETIRTEISAKFTVERITAELDRAGFAVDTVWQAPEGFALLLARRGPNN